MIKINAAGEILWKKSYGTSNTDAAYAVTETFDNSYIFGGITHGPELTHLNAFFVKTDLNGDTLWTSNCGGTENEWITDLHQSPDSGFYACGWTENPAGDDFNALLMKTDPGGNLLWSKNYGDTGHDATYSLEITSGYSILMAGFYGDELSNEIWLIKTDLNGNLLWEQKYGKTRRIEEGIGVMETGDFGIVVCGRILNTGNQYDVYLIKSDSSGNTGQTGIFPEIPAAGFNIYPNPSKGMICIDSEEEILSAGIYQINGRLINEFTLCFSSKWRLDLSDLPKGIFIVEIKTIKGLFAQKIVLR